jgi:pentatricopeptide repeat protein
MMDGLQTVADKGDALAGEVTLPLVRGITAFMNQDYDEAVRLMEPLFGLDAPYDQLSRIGGSHAQREVFEDTMVEAYLRAGRFEDAETMLGNRLKRRETPRDMFWLARAQQANGNRDAAEASVNQVRNAWVGADSDSEEIGALTQLASSLQ